MDVRSLSGDNTGVNVDNSALEASHPQAVPQPPPQSQATPASSPAADESVSSPVVPEEWKLATNLTLMNAITPKMLLSVLKECKKLRRLSANLQASGEELHIPTVQADNLRTLCITTSAELYPVFTALRLPNLVCLSVDWDRSKGHDFPLCYSALGLVQLLETSCSLKSLSLSNIFPPEDELLLILAKRNILFEELTIRGDYSHHLPTISHRRLVTERTLSMLSQGSVCPGLRTLDLSYISAEKAQLWDMVHMRNKSLPHSQTPPSWHLEFSLLRQTVKQEDLKDPRLLDEKFSVGVKDAELLVKELEPSLREATIISRKDK
ncbi:hypothetical protein DXG03_001304 [Asterophora parasitica]|uniref:Uncharacterized protein n=1 Tax=Asterophora parasitica TaxID=117018 RepID=A0A9P7K6E2_9AGAR|nr:hypothetical protein DXG03_001304 [Asterophora parasitica]